MRQIQGARERGAKRRVPRFPCDPPQELATQQELLQTAVGSRCCIVVSAIDASDGQPVASCGRNTERFICRATRRRRVAKEELRTSIDLPQASSSFDLDRLSGRILAW